MLERSWRAVGLLGVLLSASAQAMQPPPPPPPPPPPGEEATAQTLSVDGPGDPSVAADGTLRFNFAQQPLVNVGTGLVDVSAENSLPTPQSGYTPLRIFVVNKGVEPERVAIEFNQRGAGSATISKSLEVAAGRREVVTLLIPAGVTYGTLEVQSRGITEGGRSSLYFQNATQNILALGDDTQFQSAARRAPDHSSYDTLVRTIPITDAPAELPAYVGFHEVVLLSPIDQLSEGARRALEGYAATGGMLILTKPTRTPQKYLPLLASTEEGRHDYGFGYVRLCGADARACAQALTDDLHLAQPRVRPAASSTYAARYAYDSQGNTIPAKERFMLPQATAPVGRFLLIILAFTLAIGPGSVWVARKKGPPFLLLTIPATAGVTCALIVGYSVLVDGFSVHTATRGFTLLDSKNHRAVTVGVKAYYANVAPGDAQFDGMTAVLGPPYTYDATQFASIDWTNGAHFDSDFIPSRTYREWGVVGVTPTRARLLAKLSEDGRTLEVQNALGSDVKMAKLRVGEADWTIYGLRDGGSVQVPRAGGAPPEGLNEEIKDYPSRFEPRVMSRARAEPEEGEFVAYLEGPGPLPTGGLRSSHRDSLHVMRGEVER